MSVYQVAVLFEAVNDEVATAVAESISKGLAKVSDQGVIASPKISFTKFEPEQEAPAVA